MAVSIPELVEVSPEMTTIVGCGDISGAELPANAAALCLRLTAPPSLAVRTEFTPAAISGGMDERCLTLVVTHSALKRLFAWSPAGGRDDADYHLPPALAAIAERIWQEGRSPQATTAYRLGKSIELLCELVEAVQHGSLLPFRDPGSFSFGDSRRLIAAKKLIDEEWSQKLTLGQIARRCGLNRNKLTRGFRELFQCSVNEALVDRRLQEARDQLLATDLPIAIIGYRNGYSNNASFTRAFGRRFGIPPSDFRRAAALAAA